MLNLLRFFLTVDVISSFVSVGVNINTNKSILENAALFDNRYYIGLLYYVHKHAERAAKTSSHSFQHVRIIYYWYSALGPVWAETRAQSGDWYGWYAASWASS